MLHGLTERELADIYLTVPRKYNASHLRSKGVIVYQVKEEWVDLGRTVAKTTYGNEVSVYDKERTICDILRVKDKKDPQMFAYAIKKHAKSEGKNLPRLMKYAKEFGVEARATMDIDTTVRMLSLTKDKAIEVIAKIMKIDLDDGISYEIKKVEDIMEEHDFQAFVLPLR